MAAQFVTILLLFTTVSAYAFQTSTTTTPASSLVGAWNLISIETIRPDGSIVYPYYGAHPGGLIVYDAKGWMSVQIVSDPAPTVPKAGAWPEFLAAAPAEKAAAIDGYYAYFGTYTVDVAAATVTHHIKQSLRPGERGDEVVRHFSLEGDRLTLTAKTHESGEDRVRKLTWQRASAH